MSCTLEPAIWSLDTGQQIPCSDRCQLIITWIVWQWCRGMQTKMLPVYVGSVKDLHHYVKLSSIFWGCRSFQIRYAAHFSHGLAMIFRWDSLCLSAVSLSRQRLDILDFSCCPLSHVLHVTLANWQRFGFEFHLRLSPYNSEYMDISQPADYFIPCYTVPTRPNKVETAVHGCKCWLSVWTLSCRCPV